MGNADKIAIFGHNGWVASRIIQNLAAHPFHQRLRILARYGSEVSQLPLKAEVARYSWDDRRSLSNALDCIDILVSFVGPEGLKDQAKLIEPMQKISREKWKLEQELEKHGIPFVIICIRNFTSFALDSPYMNIDLPNNRIVHISNSRYNPIWLCSLDYVAAGITPLLFEHSPAQLASRLIGLNELRATTLDVEHAMAAHAGHAPQVADETVANLAKQAEAGRLDALVRKKMGDGTDSLVRDLSQVYEFRHPKMSLEDLICQSPLDDPPDCPPNEDTLHSLDKYFQ